MKNKNSREWGTTHFDFVREKWLTGAGEEVKKFSQMSQEELEEYVVWVRGLPEEVRMMENWAREEGSEWYPKVIRYLSDK